MSQAKLRAADTDIKRPYRLSEDSFETLSDTYSTMFLLGIMAVEHNPKAGDIPPEELGSTLLRLARQLKGVMADASP